MKKVLLFAAATMLLASCGGGGGRPTFGDNVPSFCSCMNFWKTSIPQRHCCAYNLTTSL